MRKPNLNALRMFDAAARHLNFRLASEELNLTQGAVAQQIRRLEDDLGIKLFQRKARGLAFTDDGRNYHRSIHRALNIIDEATQNFAREDTRLSLSVPPSLASKWLVPRLNTFSASHPHVDIRIIASDALADFRTDGVDIAIRLGSRPQGSNIVVVHLATLNLVATCNADYAKNLRPMSDIADFTTHQLIQDGHNHWDRLFQEIGIKAQHRMLQFNQTALAMDAAANGQGIALAPRLLLEADLAKGNLVALWQDERPDQGGYFVVHPVSAKANPPRDALIKWIFAQVPTAVVP